MKPWDSQGISAQGQSSFKTRTWRTDWVEWGVIIPSSVLDIGVHFSCYDFLRFIFILWVQMFLPALCMCAMNNSGTCGNQKRGVGSLGAGVAAGCELCSRICEHHMAVGSWTRVLLWSSSWALSHLSGPSLVCLIFLYFGQKFWGNYLEASICILILKRNCSGNRCNR